MKIELIIFFAIQILPLWIILKDLLERVPEKPVGSGMFGWMRYRAEKKRFTTTIITWMVLIADLIFTLIWGGIFWW